MPPVASPGLRTPRPPSSTPPSGRPPQVDPALSRVRFRRAVTLVLMTLLVPGSAQLVAGNRRVGRIALRVWLASIGTLVAVVVLGLMWHGLIYFLASNTFMLGLFRLLL